MFKNLIWGGEKCLIFNWNYSKLCQEFNSKSMIVVVQFDKLTKNAKHHCSKWKIIITKTEQNNNKNHNKKTQPQQNILIFLKTAQPIKQHT